MTNSTLAPANIINHIVLVLDASTSMQGRNAQALIKVADNQIAHLAERSKELDQETRITVYTFGSHDRFGYPARIDCLIYDKDVLRMPSIAGVYKPFGNTPLIDASLQAITELAETPERYGEHSFLVYVLTDGIENISRNNPTTLRQKINGLPEHWTVATFVPDDRGQRLAIDNGFPRDNIAVWDVTSAVGLEKAGEQMREATENFMQARRSGVRGTKQLFNLAAPKISAVKANLDPLRSSEYDIFNVGQDVAEIRPFVEDATGRPYAKGNAYYQLTKRETVQAGKQIAIMGSKGVYTGRQARDLLGLPDYEVKVDPSFNRDYDVFIQSTSTNRKLMPKTKVLVLR
ncbi:hypothetical protein KHO57_gp021 [Mycobacterium phage Phabba]|uniref:VWFA domain-containing protein n=1 Tax=Mycobacterium phage Phabba TaxID=2027899 RepID=A0A249XSB9_9CAUD|nr:hypothetical protein KHO57_gp021 [Mycobacterium phage Phabba]ASZ74596.1 hypothetical protein SEA_PHABBA_21 [Mycobacterium phage Phabba]